MAESELLALEASCTCVNLPIIRCERMADIAEATTVKCITTFARTMASCRWRMQGFGWRGIPQNIASDIPNLFQRVFYQHGEVGNIPDANPFELQPRNEGDAKYAFLTNASYSARDVVINGEELPEPFIFKLQGRIITRITILKPVINRIPIMSIRTARTPTFPIPPKPAPLSAQ